MDGRLWAKLPLTRTSHQSTRHRSAQQPGRQLDSDHGVSQQLRCAEDPARTDQVRVGSEVFKQVTATPPGELVGSC